MSRQPSLSAMNRREPALICQPGGGHLLTDCMRFDSRLSSNEERLRLRCGSVCGWQGLETREARGKQIGTRQEPLIHSSR